MKKMTKKERSEYHKHEKTMPDLSRYMKSEYDLFSCSSTELFDAVGKEKRMFYPSGGGKKVLQMARSLHRDRSQASQIEVIPLFFPGNKRKYLYYRNEHQVAINDANDPVRIRDSYTQRTSTMRLRFLQIHEIVFTESDLHLVQQYLIDKSTYVEESTVLLEFMYDYVRHKMVSRPMGRTYATPHGRDHIIKELQTQTMQRYGGAFSFIYYVLLKLQEFSFTELAVDTEQWELMSNETKAQRLSHMFHAMLTVPERRPLLHLLFRLNGYKYEDLLPRLDTTDAVRRKIDAFKQFVMYATLYNDPDKNVELFTEDEPSEWSWIKSMYQQVLAECQQDVQYMITYVPPDGLLVMGMPFSRGYIRSVYSTCVDRFEELVREVTEFYEVPSIEAAAFDVLDNPDVFFAENLLEPKTAFQDLVDPVSLAKITPKVLKPPGSLTSHLLEALDECTVLIMWMVYFTCGAPYRYPELVVVKFAGSDRNVFVDEKTRCIQLLTTYSKVRGYKKIIKLLSKKTSNYLFDRSKLGLWEVNTARLRRTSLLTPGMKRRSFAFMSKTDRA